MIEQLVALGMVENKKPEEGRLYRDYEIDLGENLFCHFDLDHYKDSITKCELIEKSTPWFCMEVKTIPRTFEKFVEMLERFKQFSKDYL